MDNQNKQKYWVVNHALTAGIKEVQGRVSNEMLVVDSDRGINLKEYYHGRNKQWCDNIDDAVRKAEEMRIKKIASLKKQIAKLEKLKFGGDGDGQPNIEKVE